MGSTNRHTGRQGFPKGKANGHLEQLDYDDERGSNGRRHLKIAHPDSLVLVRCAFRVFALLRTTRNISCLLTLSHSFTPTHIIHEAPGLCLCLCVSGDRGDRFSFPSRRSGARNTLVIKLVMNRVVSREAGRACIACPVRALYVLLTFATLCRLGGTPVGREGSVHFARATVLLAHNAMSTLSGGGRPARAKP